MKLLTKSQRMVNSTRERDGAVVETVTTWAGTLVDDAGREVPFEFDHDPTDAELLAVSPGATDIDPPAASGRKAIFQAAAAAARDWNALDRFNAKVQDPATGATNKQKTGAQALADRAYTRARKLASDYADAVAE